MKYIQKALNTKPLAQPLNGKRIGVLCKDNEDKALVGTLKEKGAEVVYIEYNQFDLSSDGTAVRSHLMQPPVDAAILDAPWIDGKSSTIIDDSMIDNVITLLSANKTPLLITGRAPSEALNDDLAHHLSDNGATYLQSSENPEKKLSDTLSILNRLTRNSHSKEEFGARLI